MGKIDGWLGSTPSLSGYLAGHNHATDIARVINAKSTDITIYRDGANLAAQTVRIEDLDSPRIMVNDVGVQFQAEAVVIGVQNHDTLDDTDIQVGDRFAVNGVSYEVRAVSNSHEFTVNAYCTIRK